MREKITIAVDAMGGDNSPKKVIEGIKISLIKNPNLKFLLFGDEKILGSYISKIIIFSLPFLIHETNLKKKFLYFFVFLIILLTTERIGLFIFITSTGILFLFSNYNKVVMTRRKMETTIETQMV